MINSSVSADDRYIHHDVLERNPKYKNVVPYRHKKDYVYFKDLPPFITRFASSTASKPTSVFTYYLYYQLHSILRSVESLPKNGLNSVEKEWLKGLIKQTQYFSPLTHNQSQRNKITKYLKQIEFVDPQETTVLDFESVGVHRIAVTGNSPESKIYFNARFFELFWGETRSSGFVDPYFKPEVTIQFIKTILTTLVHEKTHHLGVKDDAELSLDKFGEKVAGLYLQRVETLVVGDDDKKLNMVFANHPQDESKCYDYKSQVILIPRYGWIKDLTNRIKDAFFIQKNFNPEDECQFSFSNPRLESKKSQFNPYYHIKADYRFKSVNGVVDHGVVDFFVDGDKHGVNIEDGFLNISGRKEPVSLFEVLSFPKSINSSNSSEFKVKLDTDKPQMAKLVLSAEDLLSYVKQGDRDIVLDVKNYELQSDGSYILSFIWNPVWPSVRKSVGVKKVMVDKKEFVPQFVKRVLMKSPSIETSGRLMGLEFLDCHPEYKSTTCSLEDVGDLSEATLNHTYVANKLHFNAQPTRLAIDVEVSGEIKKAGFSGFFYMFPYETNQRDLNWLGLFDFIDVNDRSNLILSIQVEEKSKNNKRIVFTLNGGGLEVLRQFRELIFMEFLIETSDENLHKFFVPSKLNL